MPDTQTDGASLPAPSRAESRLVLYLALLVAALIIFAVHGLDFPGSVPNFQKASGGGVLLDVKPSFSEEEIYQRLAAYGEQGRNEYVFRNVTIDVLLPLGVLPALFLLMFRALRGASLARATKLVLYSFAFVYVVFDFAENGVVLALLAHYPERMHSLAAILPYLTIVKRIASLLAIGTPLVILSARLFQGRR
jgi:hypothetical protein